MNYVTIPDPIQAASEYLLSLAVSALHDQVDAEISLTVLGAEATTRQRASITEAVAKTKARADKLKVKTKAKAKDLDDALRAHLTTRLHEAELRHLYAEARLSLGEDEGRLRARMVRAEAEIQELRRRLA